MNGKQEWPKVLRVVWLTGGLVAVNEPEVLDVQLKTGPIGRRLATLRIPSFSSLFHALNAFGFSVVGTTFVSDSKQLEGIQATEFRAYGNNSDWPVWNTWQKWRQVVSAANRKCESQLMDVASRISAGLEYSELRLNDLAMSYSEQLHGQVYKRPTKSYQRFRDTNGPAVYKDIHALFWEMAVLRDVLAQFIALFCLSRSDITTLSSLLKSLNKLPSTDPVAQEIAGISNRDHLQGWLARFGSYRDCFTHSAPLQLASGFAFAVRDTRTLTNSSRVPQIYHALPEDPDDIRAKRSKGILFNSPESMNAASARKYDRSREPDALEYLHDSLCRLTDLANRLISRSPIKPEPVILTKDDIIGEITVTHGD